MRGCQVWSAGGHRLCECGVGYDWVAAQQEAFYYQPINTIFQLAQLSLFGEIDPNLTFRFVPLFQLTGKEEAEIRTADGATDCAYVTSSVLSPEEVRGKLARDPKSGYLGLDVGKLPVPPTPDENEEPPEGLTAKDANIAKDHIVEEDGKFKLMSHEGKNLGVFDTREEAEKHEQQVNYFKSR